MSSADFDPKSITGEWDYRDLPTNIIVGQDCWLERRDCFGKFRSHRQPGLVLGDRVRLHWAAFNVEADGWVEVGEDSVLVGPTFMCAQHIFVGKRVLISYNVTIADSDFHPIDPEARKKDAIANSPFGDRRQRPPYISRPVSIHDDVWVGIGALILKGVTIGAGARIGPGAVITKDVPAGATAFGNPAQVAPRTLFP